MTVLNAFYLVACALIFYSAFCRLVLVHTGTILRVRLVFAALAIASAFSIFGTVFWGYSADLANVLLAFTVSAVLMVSSKRWRLGVPSEYQSSRGEFDSRPGVAESRP